jgi:hypothetical protein
MFPILTRSRPTVKRDFAQGAGDCKLLKNTDLRAFSRLVFPAGGDSSTILHAESGVYTLSELGTGIYGIAGSYHNWSAQRG